MNVQELGGNGSRMGRVTNRPNLDQRSRDRIEDLGLVSDDHAEMPTAPGSEWVRL
jgi:hypothetical protein